MDRVEKGARIGAGIRRPANTYFPDELLHLARNDSWGGFQTTMGIAPGTATRLAGPPQADAPGR